MKILFVLFILITSLPSFTQEVEIDGKKVTWEDLEHENLGCPNNTTCSKELGLKYNEFIKALSRARGKNNFTSYLNNLSLKDGFPFKFLYKGILDEKKYITWDSRCDFHKKKLKEESIFVGMSFFKKLENKEGRIFTQSKFKNENFTLPLETYPLAIKNKELIVPMDINDVYFYLSIKANGEFSVIDLTQDEVNKALNAKETATCIEENSNEYFSKSFCESLYNFDTKSTEVVTNTWTCL